MNDKKHNRSTRNGGEKGDSATLRAPEARPAGEASGVLMSNAGPVESEQSNGEKAVAPAPTSNVWSRLVTAIVAGVPLWTGMAYVSGRARFYGYLEGLGLGDGHFSTTTDDIVYWGLMAETQSLIWLHTALLAFASLLGLIAAWMVLHIGMRWLKMSRWRRKGTDSKAARSQDPSAKSELWTTFPLSRWLSLDEFDDQLIKSVGVMILGTLLIGAASVCVQWVSVEQRSRGKSSGEETLRLYRNMAQGLPAPGGRDVPPVSRITIESEGRTHDVEGRVLICSEEWCAYMGADSKLFLLRSDRIVSSFEIGSGYSQVPQKVVPPAAPNGERSSHQSAPAGNPDAKAHEVGANAAGAGRATGRAAPTQV